MIKEFNNKQLIKMVNAFNIAAMTIFLLMSSCQLNQDTWVLTSPDHNMKLYLKLNDEQDATAGKLSYEVKYKNEGELITALEPSSLGLSRIDADFANHLSFVKSSGIQAIEDTYTMISGKRAVNAYKANELILTFKNKSEQFMELHLRAFNDGIAFKYVFPGESMEKYTIEKEMTTFNLPVPGKAWIQPYDTLGIWGPAYEYGYAHEIEIGDPPPMSTGWAFPALFHTNGLWVMISESGVYEQYCGSHLSAYASEGEYKIEFPWAWENYGMGNRYPVCNLPWDMPWRVIFIGDTPANIVESNLITHLARPNELDDISWIQPGKSSWSWWSDHSSGKNFKKLKRYVDLAEDMGWKYSLVDADWHIMEGGTIENLIEYAGSKNIGLFLWYNSGGPHTKVMNAGPRDLMYEREKRRKEMKRISELGVKGIKVDFFQSDKQDIMKLYLEIARDAAAFKLLLNTHGCTIPRGWHRTLPNFLSMEAVRGAELYSYYKFPPNAVKQNNIYPFTRNVIGPMDYTPVTFTNYTEETAHLTSYGHELALSVIFECGIVHMADNEDGYRNLPDKARDFLKKVPVTWDDTFFIDGYPGKFTILAREKGNNYYIAGINGEMDNKITEFNLPFVKDKKYQLEIIKDGQNNKEFEFETIEYQKGQKIYIKMLPAGGFVAVASPKSI